MCTMLFTEVVHGMPILCQLDSTRFPISILSHLITYFAITVLAIKNTSPRDSKGSVRITALVK